MGAATPPLAPGPRRPGERVTRAELSKQQRQRRRPAQPAPARTLTLRGTLKQCPRRTVRRANNTTSHPRSPEAGCPRDPTGSGGPGARSHRPPPGCSPAAPPTCHEGTPFQARLLGVAAHPQAGQDPSSTRGREGVTPGKGSHQCSDGPGPRAWSSAQTSGSWWFTAGGTRWGSGFRAFGAGQLGVWRFRAFWEDD